ncbi:MAG: hypothetical protein KDK44_03850 [Chlamydiia bacterium]|nr:hypothetical protein [Chlamydiia bacterium]MCP5509929.1 hypothetical protein [Chlamydiales bacterium]
MSLLTITASDELPPIELRSLWGGSGDICLKPHGKYGLLEYPDSDEELGDPWVYWSE